MRRQAVFKIRTPPAPVKDREAALDTLWSFVVRIGLDPHRVIASYANQEALLLGFALDTTKAVLAELLPSQAAESFRSE